MISKTEILRTLNMLDVAFRRETSHRKGLLLAKQALLELCGWVEESMDDICLKYVRPQLKDASNYQKYYESYVKFVSGFQYSNHFRPMLIGALGVVGIEKLERGVDATKKDAMLNKLNSLKIPRNTLAHTHIKNTTSTINAPSRTIADFAVIYEGLKDYERVIRSE